MTAQSSFLANGVVFRGKVTISGSGGMASFSGTSYGIQGFQTSGGSYTVYKRVLIIDVVDLAKVRAGGDAVSIWKGKVTSLGSSGDLRRVMPYLIEAGFSHFGENTTTGVEHEFFEDEEAIVKLREAAERPFQ